MEVGTFAMDVTAVWSTLTLIGLIRIYASRLRITRIHGELDGYSEVSVNRMVAPYFVCARIVGSFTGIIEPSPNARAQWDRSFEIESSVPISFVELYLMEMSARVTAP